MKPKKSSSVALLQEVARFDALKVKLLTKPFAHYLKKTLADWAVPTDRQLPLVLMGCTLGELLNRSFDEICGTPGVGKKKICSLMQLLGRAAATDPTELPKNLAMHRDSNSRSFATVSDGKPSKNGSAKLKDFSPAGVSEVLWEKWRSSVVQHGFGKEMLGRFAPRLRDVTKVIWTMPLDTYTGYTLGELRKLKTHGEKRVRAILEIFHAVHAVTAAMSLQEHLVVRIVPRRIDRVEQWIAQTLQSSAVPGDDAVFENFIGPLLEQIHDDATEQTAALADTRLGIIRQGTDSATQPVGRPLTSVRQIARDLELTRARVYQLLSEINEIMMVRWPMGRHQVYELSQRLLTDAKLDSTRDMRQFKAAIELFYPGTRQGHDGSVNPSSMDEDEDDDESFRARSGENTVARLAM